MEVIFKPTLLYIIYKTTSTYLLYLSIIHIYYNHLILIYLLHLNNNILSKHIQSIGLARNTFLMQNKLNYFLMHEKNQLPKTILKITNKKQVYYCLYLYKSLKAFHMKQFWIQSSHKPLTKTLHWIYYCCIIHLQKLSIFLNLIKNSIKHYIRILKSFCR